MTAIKKKMKKQVKARTVACIVMDYLRKTKMVKVGACVCSVIGGLMTNAQDLTVMMMNVPMHFVDNILRHNFLRNKSFP